MRSTPRDSGPKDFWPRDCKNPRRAPASPERAQVQWNTSSIAPIAERRFRWCSICPSAAKPMSRIVKSAVARSRSHIAGRTPPSPVFRQRLSNSSIRHRTKKREHNGSWPWSGFRGTSFSLPYRILCRLRHFQQHRMSPLHGSGGMFSFGARIQELNFPFFRIRLMSSGLIRSGTVQPSRSYSAMHCSAKPLYFFDCPSMSATTSKSRRILS